MGNRITFYMTIAVLGGFAVILLMNLAAVMGYIPQKYISPNEVRGIAVEHNKVLYTLNFEQQNTLIDIFNRAIPVTKESVEQRKTSLKNAADIQKIIIYRFNAPDIEIRPAGYISKTRSALNSDDQNQAHMVFSAPQWDPNNLLEEAAYDELNKVLLTTYDK